MDTFSVCVFAVLLGLGNVVYCSADQGTSSALIRQARYANNIGDRCSAPTVGPVVPCWMRFSVCKEGTCRCRDGFEPAQNGKNCISDMAIPLNSSECMDDDDCTNFPGTVCRVNRIVPKTTGIPGKKPTPSTTGKRCQCSNDKAEDPAVPFGCSADLSQAGGCSSLGSHAFCRSRNPEYVCSADGLRCDCPLTAPPDASGECQRVREKKVCSGSDPNECPSPTEMETSSSAESICDPILKRCSCSMKVQAAVLATQSMPFVPAIPVGTPGTPVYSLSTSKYQCKPVQAVTMCKDNNDCAKGLNHACWKALPTNSFGICMCKALKRHGKGGLLCSDVYGKCCNPNAPVLHQCGVPIFPPLPGVSSLTCLPASGTCGCSTGYYQPDLGCVSTPPNIGAQCDLES